MAHWWHMHFARQCWVSVASTARIRLVRLAPGSLQALSWELTKPKVARERNHAKAERAWREQQRDAVLDAAEARTARNSNAHSFAAIDRRFTRSILTCSPVARPPPVISAQVRDLLFMRRAGPRPRRG